MYKIRNYKLSLSRAHTSTRVISVLFEVQAPPAATGDILSAPYEIHINLTTHCDWLQVASVISYHTTAGED